MIPSLNDVLLTELTVEEQPSKTYRMHIEKEYIGGTCDDLESIKQAVFKIVNTERYRHMIYSWNYGIELADLFGQRIGYVVPEIQRRITEALMQDDRVLAVDNFEFDTSKRHEVVCTFVVHTAYGSFESERAVNI
jgi:hypothetical protein